MRRVRELHAAIVHTDGPQAVQSLHPAGGAARQAARASTPVHATRGLPPLPTLGGRAARALDERHRRRDRAERPSAAIRARRRWPIEGAGGTASPSR